MISLANMKDYVMLLCVLLKIMYKEMIIRVLYRCFFYKGVIFEDRRLIRPFLVAIDDINRDPNVLSGIQLQAIINVTKPQDAFDNLKAGIVPPEANNYTETIF